MGGFIVCRRDLSPRLAIGFEPFEARAETGLSSGLGTIESQSCLFCSAGNDEVRRKNSRFIGG